MHGSVVVCQLFITINRTNYFHKLFINIKIFLIMKFISVNFTLYFAQTWVVLWICIVIIILGSSSCFSVFQIVVCPLFVNWFFLTASPYINMKLSVLLLTGYSLILYVSLLCRGKFNKSHTGSVLIYFSNISYQKLHVQWTQ